MSARKIIESLIEVVATGSTFKSEQSLNIQK